MKHSEFDDALRQLVQGGSLPYDPGQWDKMARRLDAHATPKPLPARRVIPVYRLAAGAAAACLVVAATWYFGQGPATTDNNQPYALSQNAAPATGAAKQREIEQPTAALVAETVSDSRPLRRVQSSEKVAPSKPEQSIVHIPRSTQPAPVEDSAVVVAAAPPAKPEKPKRPVQLQYPTPSVAEADDEEIPRERRMAFGVNGGYNLGNAKNNFTLGVTVNRKLASRLHLETGIAVVSGTYESQQTTFRPSSNGGLTTSGDVEIQTKTSTKQLMYLQAAPSLNYELFGGVSAGGGIDAQRLLGDDQPEELPFGAKLSRQSLSQPDWDFGLTARLDVRVAKKLRAGMMYRESIRSISKESETAKRNYLLLQLSYTIF